MEHSDVMVLRTLRDWRAAGRRGLLATVVRTWGSSPRPVGSIMALGENGSVVGSVSGGCIEDDLIRRYSVALGGTRPQPPIADAAPAIVKYGLGADEAHRFGLPCGGTLELVLEFNPDAGALSRVLAALESGRLVRRATRLADGRVSVLPAAQPQELVLDATQLVNTFGPQYRMLLVGAGQLAEYLATMAQFNGFAVTVCDPREEYRWGWSVPSATLATDMPDDVVTAFRPDRRSCIVALTHDPKLDDLALLEALATEAFYVGAIGSRRNDEARRRRMREHFDVAEATLQRLRGPIGIYIGSKTPGEIAVSVMAEILAARNGVALPAAMQVGHAKRMRAVAPGDPGEVACGI